MKALATAGMGLTLCLALGCNHHSSSGDGSSTNAVGQVVAPVGPSIAGHWSGGYGDAQTAISTPLTAVVTQDGDAVTITTTRAEPRGQFFTGTIKSDGKMLLTDNSDGEIWSTYFTHATTNLIVISDFDRPPGPGDPFPPRDVITLMR